MNGWITVGRIAAFLGVLALLGAWATQIAGGTILGMDQTHLFYDAIGLFLLAIFCLMDAWWHGRRPA
ncbi:MAG: hypothetical protein ACOZNI_21015 [Myxococcota bacterium]